ncbi:MAG: hypothetical protein BWY98_01284 [Tenericutes bacterium ADurb.BinA155]|nr:MAG: hypothetical protein BWY98_01284 [Tenericutes bacterium ADurb.BinA155]
MTELKRQSIIDPAVRDIMTNQEERTVGSKSDRAKKAKERKKAANRLPGRVNLDLPLELKKRVFDLAEAERIPASQIVALFLTDGLRRLDSGDLILDPYRRPSGSPRYDWTLDISSLENLE